MTHLTLPHPVSSVHEAAALDRTLEKVPCGPGVYAFYLPDPTVFPIEVSHEPQGAPLPLYVGQTGDSLRGRVGNHLYGDARTSTMRANLGLLLQDAFDLDLIRIAGKRYFIFRDEGPIDDWVARNLILGFLETEEPRRVEADWLSLSPGILNVAGRMTTTLTKKIRLLRGEASGRCLPKPTM